MCKPMSGLLKCGFLLILLFVVFVVGYMYGQHYGIGWQVAQNLNMEYFRLKLEKDMPEKERERIHAYAADSLRIYSAVVAANQPIYRSWPPKFPWDMHEEFVELAAEYLVYFPESDREKDVAYWRGVEEIYPGYVEEQVARVNEFHDLLDKAKTHNKAKQAGTH